VSAPLLTFVQTETLGIGGSERVVLNLLASERLRSRSLLVLASDEPGVVGRRAKELGIRTAWVRGTRLRNGAGVLRVVDAIARVADRHGTVALAARGTHPQVLASLTARVLGLPSIFLANMVYRVDPRERPLIDTLALAGFMSLAVCNSGETLGVLEAVRPSVPRALMHPGTAFEIVDDDDAQEVRARLGVEPGELLIGVFGRLEPFKAQDVFIDAAAMLSAERSGLHFVVVGDTTFGLQPQFKEDLLAQATAHGLADRVHFVGFQPDVARWFRACDVVCHTARGNEAFGMVIIEAMAQGRPVVATEGGGPADIITVGEDGLLVPREDPAALAAAVRSIIDDDPRMARMGRAARATVDARFTIDRMAERFVALADDVLEGRAPS
jgi:glycosyltransferase involved in cell wall biosynthesis